MKEQYIQLSLEEWNVATEIPQPQYKMRRTLQTEGYDFSHINFSDTRIQQSLGRAYTILFAMPRKIQENE